MPGVILLYDVIYTWHAFMHEYKVLLPLLLLVCTGVVAAAAAAAVRHRMPDDRNCC